MNSIEERMELVEESVRKLKGVEVDSTEFYHFQGVKHTIQEAVEACIDIASRIIAEEGWGRGDSYTDYFETLEDQQVIDENLSSKLKNMAKFRNLVVHRYMEVEEDELKEIIEEDLDDLLEFVGRIEKYQSKSN